MAEPNEIRQLAAIMFADMVGYTAMMQVDEETTRELRDRHRDVLTRCVDAHQGRILQFYGDGTLSIFSSAVEAVKCAIAVQAEFRTPPQVPLRIGVHTGDVAQDENGVYGHGVNVAARIEGLAASGGIMISGKVYDEIRNHPSLDAIPMGPVHLKNVDHPVTVFAVSGEGLSVPTESEFRAKVPTAGVGPEAMGIGERFLHRLRERAMIQWALVYLATAWALVETVGFLSDQFSWPSVVSGGMGVAAFVGFFVALVVAWYHGEKGRQAVRASEVAWIAVILAVGAGSLALARSQDGATREPPGVATPDAEGRPSIAVLPFDNFSPSPDDAYFASGVQEDITAALARVRSLRVPARSSVARFRDDRPSTREIAEALGADYLLAGSATVVGDEARVTLQLIDGHTEEHIWADEYDHEFSVEQLIAVRTEVAQRVASQLRALITPEEEARLASLPTSDVLAWELYQRGRFRWNERSEAGVQASLRLFQEALDRDPGFAEAHAGMADAYLVLSNWGWLDHRVGHARGIAAAERSLELDPDNAGANASLGALHLWSTRDWVRSEAHFRQAIDLDDEYAYAHYWYSALLSALGRHDESIAEARKAVDLDPLTPQIAYGFSRSLFLARQHREALEETTAALGHFPDYGPLVAQLCRGHIALHEFDRAAAACTREKELSGVDRTLSMALVWAFQGERDAALTEMAGVARIQGGEELQPIFVAMIYAGLGDLDEAFERLEQAFDGDYPYLEYLPSNPLFDPLRDDRRYDELLGRIGLDG